MTININSISKFNFDSIFDHISITYIYDNNDTVNQLTYYFINQFNNRGISGYLFTDNKYGKSEKLNNCKTSNYMESHLDCILNEKCDKEHNYQFIIFDNCYIKEVLSDSYIDNTIQDLLENNTSYLFYLIFIDRDNSYLPQVLRFKIDYVFIYNNNDNYNGLLYSYFGNTFPNYNSFFNMIQQMREQNNYVVIIKNSLKYHNNEKIFYFNKTNEQIIKKCLNDEYILIIDI